MPLINPTKTNQLNKVISNYTKKLAATDPEANPIRGPPQPPSWELPEGSDFPDVSDDESESDEANLSNANNINGDKPVSLAETRKEMEERMEKKVSALFICAMELFPRVPSEKVPVCKRGERGEIRVFRFDAVLDLNKYGFYVCLHWCCPPTFQLG